MVEARSLSAVIGANLRRLRLRQGLRQEDVARVAQDIGLLWGRAAIAAIEIGRRNVSAGELLALPLVVSAATGSPVGLRDLLGSVSAVRILEGVVVPAEVVAAVLSRRMRPSEADLAGLLSRADARMKSIGEVLGASEPVLGQLDEEALARAARASALEAERKAGVRLGVAPEVIGLLSVVRWGRGLSDERDARVVAAVDRASVWDPRRIQALRGHVTRALLGELRPLVAEMKRAKTVPEPGVGSDRRRDPEHLAAFDGSPRRGRLGLLEPPQGKVSAR